MKNDDTNPKKPNILFVMADQLRADYLGCNNHPTIKTPTIDALARNGVNFTKTYCQAPVCGPSRMSFYTGRYASSHGASYNNVPLKVSEKTLGDHLRSAGYRVALVGKTHMKADAEGMERLGIDPQSSRGVLVSQCGFEPYERDDGLHPDQLLSPDLAYNTYLKERGYEGHNPWHSVANSGIDEKGNLQSGWYMRNSHLAARVSEEHSETAYTTDRAIDFINEAKGNPWCLHLSYIKPHWPYIAPAPYHNMYSEEDVQPVNATLDEKENPHPVVSAFMQHNESVQFSREEVRKRVIPAYMGLITQVDDHLARLIEHLKTLGEYENTVIVFTSDHGDYLGDHWLGEKELFHEESARIPLIIYDPRASANASRGKTLDLLAESIDLVPTFVELAGLEPQSHILEGRSLAPFLYGHVKPEQWRKHAVSEMDYAWRGARRTLGLRPDQTKATMITDGRWKYIDYHHFLPQLFDLTADPFEQNDLANEEACRAVCTEMEKALLDWYRKRKNRVTVSDTAIESNTDIADKRGYLFGYW
ncbi:alkaline phosphatase family protein [Grimontia sp. NTOU-MAR1]|uniref:alkaline phosphatase family protein n=1 Tax=Grimontia sp. NTOU-MAR1 TaxID=3111011 RepID=UPI002DB670DF|nr:alkaline phosphatase family protein [Grimontia sp. NTOU-MAR1]WRV99634.1 alkaline phosphatase family protein [Grimontia sp. NTOU-MAR1]